MVPTVTQQLAAIRHTIAKSVMPALDPDAGFAQEQAGLVLASLDWALDVVESEHRYEQIEYAEYHELLSALRGEGPVEDAPADLAALRAATIDLKRRSQAAFEAIAAAGDDAATADARNQLAAVALRQSERERAWARMTGFPGASESVADVLRDQAAAAGAR
jgi:hypothetical protein